MDGVATKRSEVLAQESELPVARSFDYSRDFRHTLIANPYMWLQIHANIHTTKVEEERGKKRRSKSQGTLEVRVSHGGCTLGRRGRIGETPNP